MGKDYGLGQMLNADCFGAVQIGNGPSNPQDLVVGPRRQAHLLHRVFHIFSLIGWCSKCDFWNPGEILHRHRCSEKFHRFFSPKKFENVVDIFLTVSKFSRDRLIMAYEIPHRKVWVLPHALPENRANPRIQNNQKTSPHFLYPANFWEHKNHKTLFVAYKSYLRQSKSPWKLVLTGHPESGNSKEIIELLLEFSNLWQSKVTQRLSSILGFYTESGRELTKITKRLTIGICFLQNKATQRRNTKSD